MMLEPVSIVLSATTDTLTRSWSFPSIFSGTLHTYSIKRLALALVIGMFVGLEREWRHKQAGVRTFGFVSLLGGLGGILNENYALLSILCH